MKKDLDASAGALIGAMARLGRAGQLPPQFYAGTVLRGGEEDLTIRCGGHELTREDLWISPRLLKDYCPKLTGTLSGTCSSHGGAVTVPVAAGQLTRGEFALKTGDTVLVFTPDQQEYFILDKAVKL